MFLGVLAALVVAGSCVVGGCVLMVGYVASRAVQPTPDPAAVPVAAMQQHQEPVLELVSWRWSHSETGAHVIAEGQARNISHAKLENVKVHVSFFTADLTFITSADSLLDFNPLLPGQTTPFKAIATGNPAMRKAQLDFKGLFGAPVPWRERQAAPKKK